MLRKRFISILLLLIVLLTFTAPVTISAAQEPEKVKVGYFIHDGFQNYNADGSYSGYSYDYLQKIADYADIRYEFIEGTWTQCLQWLKDGTIDMLGFMLKTDDREEVYDFPIWNCGYNSTKLLTLKNNTTFAENAWDEFDGMRVGFVENSQLIKQFAQLAKDQDFSYSQKLYNTQEEVNTALKNGDVDAICVSNVKIPYWSRVLSVFDPQPIYYAVTKGNTELLDKLNYAIGEIKTENPTFEQSLRAKYYEDDSSDTVVFSQAEKEFISNSAPISIAIDPAYQPIEGVNKQSGKADGYTTQLLEKISKLSGLKFEYHIEDSYTSAIQNFYDGDYDILSAVNQSFFDSDSCVFSDTWLEASVVMVGTDLLLDNNDSNLKIAALPRTTYLKDYVKTQYPNCQFISFDTVPQALEAISKNEVDLAIINIYSFQAATLLSNPRLKIVRDIGRLFEYRFAYHQDVSEELVSIINKCINSISESESNSMLASSISGSVEPKNDGWKILVAISISALIMVFAIYLFLRLRKSRRSLVQLAYYDPLTGARNLAKFVIDAKEIVRHNPQRHFSVRVFDIRNFQMFNDFYGFEEGNTLLCSIVKAMEDVLDDKTELIGRVNADQFVTLTVDISISDFERRIEKYRDLISKQLNDRSYKRVVYKTGSYVLMSGETDIAAAVEKAMLAHKAAKSSGKDCVFFDDKMKSEAQKEQIIENEMEVALEKHEFVLYLQPQYKITNNRIIGIEALVRWQREDGSIIMPNDFIPLFEKNGFVMRLD